MLTEQTFGPVRRYNLARTIMGRGRYWTAAYWVDGLLIDSGCAHTASELLRALDELPLEQIFTTHSHEDHFGAHGPLQRQRGIPIYAHPLAVPVLAQPARLALQPYRRLFWGEPSPCRAEALSEGAHLGSERYTFHILYTPGHSPDHLCLFEPDNGWLFSGDLYVGGKDQALREGSDFWGILKALKYVAKLPITLLFPGSARVRPYPAQALQEKVDYLEELAGQVLELHRRGWSKRRIARRLLRAPRALEWLTLGHFSRRHLIRSILRGAGG